MEGYRFDVPEGEYEIELLFADVFNSGTKIIYNINDNKQGLESGNIFDIYINDKPVDYDVSIGHQFGYFSSVKKRFIVDVSKDGIYVKFYPKQGKAFLNGIKLRKL